MGLTVRQAKGRWTATLVLVLLGVTGCGSGAYLLPPHSGGGSIARAYQEAVESHYRSVQGNVQAAVTAEELAIAHDPSWAPAYARLATLFLTLGEPEAALTTAKDAVRVAPKTSLYETNLGKLAASLGRSSLARSAYQRAVELNPGGWSAMDGLAQLDVASKHYIQAARWLERAMAAGGPEAPTWQIWGSMAQAEGNWSLATRYYHQAEVADPAWWQPHYDLARAALRRHRVAFAGRQLRAALADDPGSSQAWLLLQSLPSALAHWKKHVSGEYPVDGSKTLGA